MEKLDLTIALSHSADFDEHTWTFQPVEKSFKVRAGTYAIIHKPELDEYVKDIAIEFYNYGENYRQKFMNGKVPLINDEAMFSQFLADYKRK